MEPELAPDLARRQEAFISAVSHEIRTPLTIIHGVRDLLVRRLGDDAPELGPLLDSLEAAVTRLDDLLSVVLVASGDDGAVASDAVELITPLEQLLDDLADHFSRRHGAGRVHVHVIDGQYAITSSEDVRLLLRTLLDNALKFSPVDRHVDVEVTGRDRQVEVRIRDRGPGISPTMLRDVFHAFTQGDVGDAKRFQGLGLGLFTARRLADRLGADLVVAPHPDGGTEAVVRLPLPVVTAPLGPPVTWASSLDRELADATTGA